MPTKKPAVEKAMVLCAGLGTRLLPITERYPKPIVPILNIPNLLHIFYLLEKAGIREAIINLYHLPERIEEFLTDKFHGRISISFSRETQLLGTGGGVKRAQPFFGNSSFVLANCDFVTNAPIKQVIERHLKRDAIATMLLFEDKSRTHLYSKVGVDARENLCSLPRKEIKTPSRTGIFTGIHVLSPKIFEYLEERPSGINEILYPALMLDAPQRIFGDFPKDFYWYDTGDLPAFHHSTVELLNLLKDPKNGVLDILNAFDVKYREQKKHVWVAEGSEISQDVSVQAPVLVGKGCLIGKGSTIGPYTILGDNVVIGEKSHLKGCIALSGAMVEPNTQLENHVLFERMALDTTPST
jgi:mannose-1-phosphate guanylyltransferase / phosphomannomutase